MQFSIIAILASAAAMAVASPQGVPEGYDNNSPGNGQTGFGACSVGTKISCCNTSQGSGGLLTDILGGSCTQIPVLAVDTDPTCTGGNTFCCPTTKHGFLDINLSCNPITLKLR